MHIFYLEFILPKYFFDYIFIDKHIVGILSQITSSVSINRYLSKFLTNFEVIYQYKKFVSHIN